MFKFLKEKLKSAVSAFTGRIKKEVEEPVEKKKPAVETKKPEKKVKEKKQIKKPEKAKKPEKKIKEKEKIKEEAPEKVSIFGKLKNLIAKEEAPEKKPEKIEAKKEEKIEKEETKAKAEEKPEKEIIEEEKRGFFGKITDVFTTKILSEQKFEELFWDLEVTLMENNVALSIIEKIKTDMRGELVEKRLKRGELDKIIFETLRKSVDEILTQEKVDLLKKA